jgi:hypothetical protein
MECAHRVCENCVRTFGKANDDPWLFMIDACFLCRLESQISVRIHPPTTGPGILCVDGGGVRGIIPTTILEVLEERIGLPIPIQEHFRLALGVSAGMCTMKPRRDNTDLLRRANHSGDVPEGLARKGVHNGL